MRFSLHPNALIVADCDILLRLHRITSAASVSDLGSESPATHSAQVLGTAILRRDPAQKFHPDRMERRPEGTHNANGIGLLSHRRAAIREGRPRRLVSKDKAPRWLLRYGGLGGAAVAVGCYAADISLSMPRS
jgi:hypothetical protein